MEAFVRRLLRLETEQLLRRLCPETAERRAVRAAADRALADVDPAEVLEPLSVPAPNPNAVHPWVRKTVKETLEPLVREARDEYRKQARGRGDA